MANELDGIHRFGGDVAAVVVDSPARNAAFATRWRLNFPIHSDPGGERILQPLDMWNPDERDGIARPTLLLVAPAGTVVYRYRSRDFADRPTDDDLFDALRTLALPALQPAPPSWRPDAEPIEDPGAFRTDAFGAYFRGIRSAAFALAGRLRDETDRAEALAMSRMAASYLDAWKTRRQASA